ncbi:MAG: biopolymer transporter ExbD [Bacteroidota bacterium]
MKNKNNRTDSSINAGSMADVAFLLLIFFLVVTTIDVDKGISVLLPPYCEECDDSVQLPPSRLLSIKVNAANELLVRGDQFDMVNLKEQAKTFIMNPEGRDDYPDRPNLAVISIQNDRATNYAAYLTVYNEVKAAYNELWETEAQRRYGAAYASLSNSLKKTIRDEIPLVISEAEPTNFALAQ